MIKIMLLVAIPLILICAYGDSIVFNEVSFVEYIKYCTWELFIAYIGVWIGYNMRCYYETRGILQ